MQSMQELKNVCTISDFICNIFYMHLLHIIIIYKCHEGTWYNMLMASNSYYVSQQIQQNQFVFESNLHVWL